MAEWTLSPDRFFAAEPSQRSVARRLYEHVKELPLVCPHGHVPPELLADPDARLASPAELFIIPDHYVTRMLYSQGVPLEDLGIPTLDGAPTEADHRKVWQRFAENFHLFRGTPTGLWLKDELITLFDIRERPNRENAQRIYDQIQEKLEQPEFRPRALFKRYNIETLCTTDAATDSLAHHRSLREEGWGDLIRPTFRPDQVVNLDTPGWKDHIEQLSACSGIDVVDVPSFVRALEERRRFFKELGAVATDHAALTAQTERLSEREAEAIFGRALRGEATADDAARFTAHMLNEMARMSREDGLVMQLHIGSLRNHNESVFRRFGPDRGADIPVAAEWTRALYPLLNAYGNDPGLHIVLFTLDETTYGRELAPLAGHYPALYLGAPWWFFDSPLGMRRFLDAVIETAGIYNLAGFNDDTRAFASIPARHDMWRRVSCNWLAGHVAQGTLDEDEAFEAAYAFAYGLPKRAYKLD